MVGINLFGEKKYLPDYHCSAHTVIVSRDLIESKDRVYSSTINHTYLPTILKDKLSSYKKKKNSTVKKLAKSPSGVGLFFLLGSKKYVEKSPTPLGLFPRDPCSLLR